MDTFGILLATYIVSFAITITFQWIVDQPDNLYELLFEPKYKSDTIGVINAIKYLPLLNTGMAFTIGILGLLYFSFWLLTKIAQVITWFVKICIAKPLRKYVKPFLTKIKL